MTGRPHPTGPVSPDPAIDEDSAHRAGTRRQPSDRWSVVLANIIVISTFAAVAVEVLDAPEIIRGPVIIWFVVFCPGVAIVRLFRLRDPLVEITIGVALSLSLVGLIPGVFLYLGRWSIGSAFAVLIVITVTAVVLDSRLVPRGRLERAIRRVASGLMVRVGRPDLAGRPAPAGAAAAVAAPAIAPVAAAPRVPVPETAAPAARMMAHPMEPAKPKAGPAAPRGAKTDHARGTSGVTTVTTRTSRPKTATKAPPTAPAASRTRRKPTPAAGEPGAGSTAAGAVGPAGTPPPAEPARRPKSQPVDQSGPAGTPPDRPEP